MKTRYPLLSAYFFPLVGLTFFQSNALADTEIERVISVESSNFSGDTSTAEIATPAEDLDELTVDFSMLDEEEFSVQWSAPAGMLIEITRPEGFDTAFFFEFVLETGGTSSDDSFDDTDPSVVYTNLSGATPSAISRLIRLSGPSLEGAEASIIESLAPGESIQFSSMQVSTTVQETYDEDINNLALTQFSLRGTATGGATDPGQWIRLIDDTTSPVFDPTIIQKSQIKRKIRKTKQRIRAARFAGRDQKVRKLKKKLRKLKAKRRAL